ALLVGTIAPAMVDQLVDSFATPRGLVDLLGKDLDAIAVTRTGFSDVDEYTVELGKRDLDPGKTVRAVLRRQGIVWRVVRVEFPAGKAPGEASVLGAGLRIDKLTPARTANGLVIEGDISNTVATAREVPRLRVALRDAADREVQFKVI